MAARTISHFAAALVLTGLNTAVMASDPDRGADVLGLRLDRLPRQPRPLTPSPVRSPLPSAARGALPAGAVARLGDARLRHAAPATCITFSPDSKRIISGGQDERLRVWDARTGRALRSVQVTYIPAAVWFTHNGARLAVAVGNGSPLRLLHPESLEPESAVSTGNGNEVAVSEDGKLIASIASNNLLTVTEIDTGLPRLEIPLEDSAGCRFVFLPEGKSIAVADRAGKVTLFKVAGGKPFLAFDHGGPIDGLIASGDGRRFATGGAGPGTSLKIWDLAELAGGKSAKPVAEIAGVYRPRLWFGNTRIAAANREGAGIYDLTRKRWVGFARGVGEEWAISPDEKLVASTGPASLRIRIWELDGGKQLHAENDSFPNAALLHPSPDGKSLFILAGDTAYLWSAGERDATAVGQLPTTAIVAATGGGRLAIATPKEVLIYDRFDPKSFLAPKPDRRLNDLASDPRAIAVSPDGRRVAYSGEAERIVIADAATGKTIRVLPAKTIGLGLAFTQDASKLAVAGRDGFLRLWPIDSAMGEDSDLWSVRLQRSPRAAVAFNADWTRVAVTSATMIKVVNAATGEVVAQLDRRDVDDGVFQQVAFSPDSRRIVAGSAGTMGAVHVYELESRTLLSRYRTFLGSIHRLAMFPDGLGAASAGADEAITVWDLTAPDGMQK